MEIMKTQIDQMHKENGNLKKKMAELHKDHEVVVKELEEHLKTEDILTTQVKVMKEEKKCCEKDKLVTAHVAEEMRSLLEPQEYTIFNLKEQNNGLTMEIKNLHRREINFKNEIDKMKLLQKSSGKENRSLKLQLIMMTNKLKSLRNDISMIRSYEPKKLLYAFHLIVRKHLTEADKMAELDISEAIDKELKPHEYKILQLIASGPKAKICPKRRGYTKEKLVKENRFLIQKLQSYKSLNDQLATEMKMELNEEISDPNTVISLHMLPSALKLNEEGKDNAGEGNSSLQHHDEQERAEQIEKSSLDADKAICFVPSSEIKVVAYHSKESIKVNTM